MFLFIGQIAVAVRYYVGFSALDFSSIFEFIIMGPE